MCYVTSICSCADIVACNVETVDSMTVVQSSTVIMLLHTRNFRHIVSALKRKNRAIFTRIPRYYTLSANTMPYDPKIHSFDITLIHIIQ